MFVLAMFINAQSSLAILIGLPFSVPFWTVLFPLVDTLNFGRVKWGFGRNFSHFSHISCG